MKYSLRTLMIVIMLVCVLLGIVMGRIHYLHGMAARHQQEANRLEQKISRDWDEKRKSNPYFLGPLYPLQDEFDREFHEAMAQEFQKAANRPWTIVGDVPPGWTREP